MTRLLFADTESTGFMPGAKICEIAIVETIDGLQTGRVFHSYLNPEMQVTAGAFKIHGLSNEFLETKPTFAQIWPFLLRFLNDGGPFLLVAHNIDFDLAIINAELTQIGVRNLPEKMTFCTLAYARRVLPGRRHNLNALCELFGIKNTNRQLHGAYLDVSLLIQVYQHLTNH